MSDYHKKVKIDPVEYIVSNDLGFIEGNIVAHVTRLNDHGSIEDVNKIIYYAQLLKDMYFSEYDRNR
jgi:hypothetical protein